MVSHTASVRLSVIETKTMQVIPIGGNTVEDPGNHVRSYAGRFGSRVCLNG